MSFGNTGRIRAGDVEWHVGVTGMETIGNSLQQGRAALVGFGGAITGAIGAGVKAATDFGGAMAEVSTLGVKDLDGLTESVKDVSGEFGLGLVDSAKAAYQAISAGATEAQTPKLLADAAMAATAGVSDLTTAIELGTSVSNAYGKELTDVNQIYDQAFVAVKNGVTTFNELSASVGKVSPTMAGLNLESKEMFSALAASTKAGINTAESVTGLKAALNNVIKPTAEAQKAAEEMGLQFDTSALSTKGLYQFLMDVKEATGGNVDKMAQLFSSTEALNVVLALTGEQATSFKGTLDEINSGAEATREAFQKIVDNDPGFAWRQLKAELQIVAIEIGQAVMPALKMILEDFLKPGVAWIREFTKEHPKLFQAIVMVVGGIGTLSLSLGTLGYILGPIGGLIKGVTGVMGLMSAGAGATAGAGGIGALIAALSGPVGLGVAIAAVVISIGTLVKAAYDAKKASNELKENQQKWADQTEKQVQILEAHGVEIDRNKMATMSFAEKIEYMRQQEQKFSEQHKRELPEAGDIAVNQFGRMEEAGVRSAENVKIAWGQTIDSIRFANWAGERGIQLPDWYSPGPYTQGMNIDQQMSTALNSLSPEKGKSADMSMSRSMQGPQFQVNFNGNVSIRGQEDIEMLSRELAERVFAQLRSEGYVL